MICRAFFSRPWRNLMITRFARASVGLAVLIAFNVGASNAAPVLSSATSSSPTVSPAELAQRREAALAQFRDGILLLHSGSGFKRWEDYGFRQDANFYYLTGMPKLHDAILVLDGPRHEVILFVRILPPLPTLVERMSLFSGLGQYALPAGAASASLTGVTRVENWDDFSSWLDARLKDDPKLSLYLDDGGQVGAFAGTASDPAELLPVANGYLLWSRAIQTRSLKAKLEPAHAGLNAIRAVKSDHEIVLLRRAAHLTQPGIDAAIRALRPRRTQFPRQTQRCATLHAIDSELGRVVRVCARPYADATCNGAQREL
jgi:Xaa-Pro aminopeptidase